MYQSFENLGEDKRNKIIDACLEEFAKNGYEKASTNEIVKKAGISKGLLFHYFKSKKNLYLYVLDYILDFMLEKFYKMNTDPPKDIFNRLMDRSFIKMRMAREYPLMYQMLYGAYINTPADLKPEMKKRYERILKESLSKLSEGIDTSKFRSDIDHRKAVSLITFFLDSYTNSYMEVLKNSDYDEALKLVDKLRAEVGEYFEILKKGIYKP